MSISQTPSVSPIPVYAELPERRLRDVDESYQQLLNCDLKKNTELRLSQHNKFYTIQVGATGILGKGIEKIVNLFIKLRHERLGFASSDKLSDRLIEVFNAQAMLALGQDVKLKSHLPTINRLNQNTASFKLITNYLKLYSQDTAKRVRNHIKKFNELDKVVKSTRDLTNVIVQGIINNTFNKETKK